MHPVASALVVEDEPAVRRLLLAVLEELELKVFAAGTMAEASRIASTEQIDLLITDGTLPDGSGRMLARTARAARPHLRVLLVSGAPEDTHEFDATLYKPFTRESPAPCGEGTRVGAGTLTVAALARPDEARRAAQPTRSTCECKGRNPLRTVFNAALSSGTI